MTAFVILIKNGQECIWKAATANLYTCRDTKSFLTGRTNTVHASTLGIRNSADDLLSENCIVVFKNV